MSLSSPAAPPAPTTASQEVELLGRNWWQLLALGLVSVIAGLAALSCAFTATMATVTVFGVLLLIAGIAEVIHAVMVRNLRGFALHLLGAALYLLTGLFLLEDPIQAALVITLLFAAAFIVGGLLRVIFSIVVQPHGWVWVALNGAIDLLLGVFVWNRWPESSLRVIGLFVGIDLLFHGWSWVILALTVRTAAQRS